MHSHIEGQLSCSLVLAIKKKAAMTIHMDIVIEFKFSIHFDKTME
jgi:hypothetical protein